MLSHERRENHLQESAPTTRCAFAPAPVETENKVADQATAGAAERHSGPAPSPKDMTINLKVQKQRHLPNVSCAHPNTPVAESQLDTSAPRHSERQALPTTPGDVFGDTLVPPGAGAAEAPGKSWEHSCPRGPLSANEPPSSGQHAGPPAQGPPFRLAPAPSACLLAATLDAPPAAAPRASCRVQPPPRADPAEPPRLSRVGRPERLRETRAPTSRDPPMHTCHHGTRSTKGKRGAHPPRLERAPVGVCGSLARPRSRVRGDQAVLAFGENCKGPRSCWK